MVIESIPMLERTLRSYELYLSQLERERDTCFITYKDESHIALENINAEIDATNSFIHAINFELTNKSRNENHLSKSKRISIWIDHKEF